MAGTSKVKKRKLEEKHKTDIGRTVDTNMGTSESESMSNMDGIYRKGKKSIRTLCSPTRFVNLRTKLKNEFLMAVRDMGFSSLLEMSSCTIFRPLVGWLIENFDVKNATLSVHGKTFILTPLLFGTVMGVKDGGEDFEREGSLDDVKRRQDAVRDGNATLSLARLEKKLIEAKSVDDLFVTRFVLFTVRTLLMPMSSDCVGTLVVSSINGLESVRKKNWATKSFMYLVDAIRDFKEKKGAFVGGCVLFLQVFYLHHLEGHNQYVDRSILPIAAWTEKRSKDVVAWINEGSCYIQMRGTNGGCYKCQSMHGHLINMMTEIKKCTSEIQELKRFVIGMQQSISENVEKEISKMMLDFTESLKGGQEGRGGASGAGRIERNHIIASDDDESESVSSSWSMHSSSVYLQADSIAMYKDFVSSGGLKIGPFKLTKALNGSESKIAMCVFDGGLDKSEFVARYERQDLSRYDMLSLKPRAPVSSVVIDAYANLLTGIVGAQYEIAENRECWFLPSTISMVANCKEFRLKYKSHYAAVEATWRKYFGNISKCTKIVIPVLVPNDSDWLTAVVNLSDENVVLWHSMAVPHRGSVRDCEEAVINTLHVLDELLAGDIRTVFPNGFFLHSFKIIHERCVQQHDNGYDSGIYTMKHMWAASKNLDRIPEFDPVASRLQLAIELVRSPFNIIRTSVLEKCSSHFDLLIGKEGLVESGVRSSFSKVN